MLFRFITLFTLVLGTSIVGWSADVADAEVPTGDTAAIPETPSQSPRQIRQKERQRNRVLLYLLR